MITGAGALRGSAMELLVEVRRDAEAGNRVAAAKRPRDQRAHLGR